MGVPCRHEVGSMLGQASDRLHELVDQRAKHYIHFLPLLLGQVPIL